MTIIVPIDFSPISLNAANFAAKMLAGQYEAALVLYHVYKEAGQEAIVRQELREVKDSLLDENVVKIETVAEQSDDFIESLDRKVRHLDASLVVMAITEKSKLEQAISGSNSLRMIERNLCPVLVIPHDARFNTIRNVALASDFKDVEHSIPLVPVKKVLNLFRPNLHIVNINSEIYVSLNQQYIEQRTRMLEMFEEFRPEFYFITTFDFHETLRQFIADKQIDMVLTFPRSHSFINNLIKGNNTKKLVLESAVPVLAAHE
ncbi:MAG TPA: universal stress protein [Flavisolibacter sp.]|nr:universal stress protein [Flavisolibacter sp.]